MAIILLVEDSPEVTELVRQSLFSTGISVTAANNVTSAKRLIDKTQYDLFLLDVGLPDGSGFDICTFIRNHPEHASTPILFLSGHQNIESKLNAFLIGADDYIVKPFNLLELRARVQSRISKRSKAVGDQPTSVVISPFRFELEKHKLINLENGKQIELTTKELGILYFLARRKEVIFSREQILASVWGRDTNVTDRTVDTHVYSLRKKLGPLGDRIRTCPGAGYSFEAK